MASSETNKAIVRRLLEEGFNKNDLSLWDELTSPDVTMHSSPLAPPGDRDAWMNSVRGFHRAFPGISASINMMVAEGDTVVVLETITGTQNDEFLGFPSNGTEFTIHATAIFELRDGLIIKTTTVADMMGALVQLGHVPPPG